jgi:hypothetical protein
MLLLPLLLALLAAAMVATPTTRGCQWLLQAVPERGPAAVAAVQETVASAGRPPLLLLLLSLGTPGPLEGRTLRLLP